MFADANGMTMRRRVCCKQSTWFLKAVVSRTMKKILGTFEATNRDLNTDRSDKVTLEKMMFVSMFMRSIELRVPTVGLGVSVGAASLKLIHQ